MQNLISRLQSREPLPSLFPTQIWDTELSREIQNAPDLSDSVRAGLLLWNDDLEASHNISQGLQTPTGSFWHAIIHRREGDASNSLYWWRRTGNHPAFVEAYESVLAVLANEQEPAALELAATLQNAQTWRPDEFVKHCERAAQDDGWLRRVQVVEIENLLRWCQANHQ